jgi:hypothetical protein
VRRLGFQLVTPLPATVMIPTPGPRSGILSALADEEALPPGGLANGIDPLLTAPAAGCAREWTAHTLRWRLARPGARYALHRREDLLAVSCVDTRNGVRVAIISKLFSATPVAARTLRALVRAACGFHRAPMVLYVGLNELARFSGAPLPRRLRESPLNLVTGPSTAHRTRRRSCASSSSTSTLLNAMKEGLPVAGSKPVCHRTIKEAHRNVARWAPKVTLPGFGMNARRAASGR